ncbi:MAG: extracellular solute-binding protein, partial [Bacteroidales bacterium]|nr:extracellular solute-binding protein [Bacteroidales bacterium]
MRYKLLRGAGVLLAAIIFISTLAGCGTKVPTSEDSQANPTGGSSQDPSSGETSQKEVTLTIELSQEMKNNNPYAFHQPNIDAFEKEHPNIKVKLILNPDAQALTILQTKLAAGQPSDLINYSKVAAENELNVVNNFVDLSNEPWVANLTNPDAFRAPDGKIYGFAVKNMTGGMGIVYNKDIFKQLNLTVPKTFDQFVQVCETIKNNGINPIYAPFKDVWTFQMWTTSAWGYYVAKFEPDLWEKLNTNELNWADVPAFQDSLAKLYGLFEKGYMQKTLLSDDYNSVPQAFEENKNAMMMGSDATATDLIAKIPNADFGMFPLPLFEGESDYLTIGQLDGVFFIPKDAKNIEEAKEFLNFMAQPAQLNAAQQEKAFSPSIKGAEEPTYSPFMEEIFKTYNEPGNVVTEMNCYMKVDLNDLWRYYQEMFAGQKTPEEVLKSWDVKFDEL